jgi:hypothetical protein
MTNPRRSGGETASPGRPLPAPRPVPSGRPDRRRGLLFGAAMALPFVAVWALASAVLDVGGAVLVVAGAAGWLIGTAVALGAEPGSIRRSRGTVLLAMAVSLAAWPAATIAAWLLSRAILQASTLTFAERLAATPLLDFAGPQFVPLGPLELGVLALFGWLGSR